MSPCYGCFMVKVLSAATLMVALVGCGPTLKRDESYSVRAVREITFADRCELQDYFDANPPPLRRRSELAMGADKDDSKSVGRVTFQITNWSHRETFYRLLDQIYHRVPRFDRQKKVLVTVPFYRRGPYTHVPLGATFAVEASNQRFTLPYSPCMAFFFFGRDYYKARRQVLTSGRKRQRATNRAPQQKPADHK